MDQAKVIELLRAHRRRFEALGVKRMFLFGSVARRSATTESDVDVMVDLDEGPTGRKPLFSAFDVGGIRFEIADILNRRIDLVVRADALKPTSKLRGAAERQLVDVF